MYGCLIDYEYFNNLNIKGVRWEQVLWHV